MTGLIALVLALAALAGPLRAATVTYSLILPTAVTPNPLATSTAGASVTLVENVTGTILNDRRSPWEGANAPVLQNSAAAVYSALRRGTATFDFGRPLDHLGFVWGTPGPQNTVTLFLNGVQKFTLTGAAAQPLAQPGAKSLLTSISGVRFDTLVFGAGSPALEFANLEVALAPVPAAGLLLATAIGGLALARRRRAARTAA